MTDDDHASTNKDEQQLRVRSLQVYEKEVHGRTECNSIRYKATRALFAVKRFQFVADKFVF